MTWFFDTLQKERPNGRSFFAFRQRRSTYTFPRGEGGFPIVQIRTIGKTDEERRQNQSDTQNK